MAVASGVDIYKQLQKPREAWPGWYKAFANGIQKHYDYLSVFCDDNNDLGCVSQLQQWCESNDPYHVEYEWLGIGSKDTWYEYADAHFRVKRINQCRVSRPR